MVRLESFAVDLYGGYTDTKVLKQYDDTVLEIGVFANGKPFAYESVKLAAQLADETVIIQKKNITTDGNKAVIELDSRIICEAGEIRFELIFYNAAGKQISSYVFGAYVEARISQNYNPEIPPDMSDYVRKNEVGNAGEILFDDGVSFQAKLDAGDLNGTDGTDGSTILIGGNNPEPADGKLGDIFINSATWNVYEKKNATTWQIQGNIKGVPGEPGTPGVPEPPPLRGEDDPTTAVAGTFGQQYINTVTGRVFVCVDDTEPYVWMEQNKDWSEDITDKIETAIGGVLAGEF